jgi:hypothetical protein
MHALPLDPAIIYKTEAADRHDVSANKQSVYG